MEIYHIGNGIRFLWIPENKFKTVVLCVLLRRNLSKREATGNALVSNIIGRGSKKYNSLAEIAKQMEELYGGVFDCGVIKKGEEQILQLFCEVIQNQDVVKAAIELIGEVLSQPFIVEGGFHPEYVESEKIVLKNEIENRINSKGEYAKLRCLEEMCGNEPFGIYGDGYLDEIKNWNSENLLAQFMKVRETSPMEIVVVGNINEKEIIPLVKDLFQRDQNNIAAIQKPEQTAQKTQTREIHEEMDLTQGKLCMGFRSGIEPTSKSFFDFMIFSEILGGGGNSKLFTNVREKESLCYSIHSFIYRAKGILFVQSGIDMENLQRAKEIILEQIDDLANKGITEEELAQARENLNKKIEVVHDAPYGLMDFYATQLLFDETAGIDQFQAKISRVLSEDVQNVAKKIWLDTVYTLGANHGGGAYVGDC